MQTNTIIMHYNLNIIVDFLKLIVKIEIKEVFMKKRFLYFIAVLIVMLQASYSCSLAANNSISVKNAIKNYQAGNYTGCLQACQSIIARDPSNATAYYYMGMAYTQAGKKKEAINAYSKVLSLNANPKLKEYATTGKRCLETPDKCVISNGTEISKDASSDIDKLINSRFTDGLSDTVRKDFEQKRLDSIKNDINNDKTPNNLELRQINDASGEISPINTDKSASKQPTNEEIAAALKVLNDAGLNSYQQMQASLNASYPNDQVTSDQNPQMTQLNMLLNGNNSYNTGSALNMLPFMLAQNKNGTSNYSPQLIQSAIMNSMMTNLNFDANNGDGY